MDEIVLTKAECESLLKFLVLSGYISYEYHADIHVLIARLVQITGHEFVEGILSQNNKDYRSKVSPQDLIRERG